MRSFKLALKSVLIFLLIIIAVSAVIIYPYFHSESYYYQDGYVRRSFAGELDFIICGASQAQRGICPTVLDGELGCNSYNIGTPLLTIKGRYYLLKEEIARNPIKTVIIELCYDTMARDRDVVGAEGDYYMLGRFTDPVDRLGYFLSSARIDEYADFYYDTLQRGIFAWQRMGSNEIGTAKNYTAKGFTPLTPVPIEMISPEDFNKEEILTDFADENIKYLDKIFELCRENDIEVTMISTPLSDAAVMSYDKLDIIQQKYNEIAEKWDCDFYNFSLYKGKSELFKDSEAYYDRNHLGEYGAELFTPLLAEILCDENAEERFYQSYAEAQEKEIIPLLEYIK